MFKIVFINDKNVVRTTRLWNNPHQVRLKSKDWKTK